jgi:hypothetical protein
MGAAFSVREEKGERGKMGRRTAILTQRRKGAKKRKNWEADKARKI